MILKNKEKIKEYNIKKDWYKNRINGHSAMLRVKNEERFIVSTILSIWDFFDEIIVASQQCTDRTNELLKKFPNNKLKIYKFPFNSMPDGPGYLNQDDSSIYSRTYYYNWILAKTTRTYVTRWDGDMIALSNLKNVLKLSEQCDGCRSTGLNIIRIENRKMIAGGQKLALEFRTHKVSPETYYINGPICEILIEPPKYKIAVNPKYAFLHFTYECKINYGQAWVKNWKNIPHFTEIISEMKNKTKSFIYNGEIPSVLKKCKWLQEQECIL